jgi:pimeloyl-ACP methyl ester carboxylesterase
MFAVIATAVSTIGLAVATQGPSRAAAPSVQWTKCHVKFFCAKIWVPLDYTDPHGTQIPIAVVKQPATDPARRIGSVFINPGGPGGSGVDAVLDGAAESFTPAVRARFDVIGFDPRGILRSHQLRCFRTQDESFSVLAPFPYPNSAKRRAQWFASDEAVEAACGQRGSAILDHMATADAARDLDRLRQAVGDRTLNYYGVSYGSFLGNMYANLFPGRVRSVTIDGVLDPVAWTTGRGGGGLPFSTRLHSAAGALMTLREFFRLCNAHPVHCAFAPHARSKYWQLYHSLRAHPLHLRHQPLPYDESFLVGDTLGSMYSSADWPGFAQFLQQLYHRAAPVVLTRSLRSLRSSYAPYFNFVEGFPGVACSDSVNPQSRGAWTRAARIARRTDGLFGPIWTWVSSVCAHWPGHDTNRYLGPFNRYTAHPVLLVGNLFDPATPYQDAQRAARLLPNSRLLTVHGWGHTSLFISTCATDAISHYLLTTQVPARGTVCNADVTPFAQAPPAPAQSAQPRVSRGGEPRTPVW